MPSMRGGVVSVRAIWVSVPRSYIGASGVPAPLCDRLSLAIAVGDRHPCGNEPPDRRRSDPFQAHHADIRDPAQQPRIAAQLRDQGLVTFSGIADPAALTAAARRLMAIRPRRNAGPDGVTVITTPVLSTSTRRTDTASSVISAEASEGSRELAR